MWNTLIYHPIEKTLIFIAQHITMGDLGLAVIILTVFIRLALFPLSKKSIISQYKMRALQPKLDAIKAQGFSKEAEAQATFALYKEEKMNPLSGCLYLLIQFPILIALSILFLRGLGSVEGVSPTLLGLVDLSKPFFPFALLAGIFQAIQAFLAPKPVQPSGTGFQAQMARSMSTQTRYVLPLIVIFFASKYPAALSLYWMITNIFSIGQELYIRKKVAPTLTIR